MAQRFDQAHLEKQANIIIAREQWGKSLSSQLHMRSITGSEFSDGPLEERQHHRWERAWIGSTACGDKLNSFKNDAL